MATHLISIGISKYANPASSLGFPAEDAGEFTAILRNSIDDLTFDKLIRNSEATQINIRTVFGDTTLTKATANDTLVVFYSGHGGLTKNADDELEAYLVPYDANDNLNISGISTTELKELIDGFGHGQKILLLDCCYSGSASSKSVSKFRPKAGTAIKAFQNQTYAEGTLVFTACKENEEAYEFAQLKHGVFTYCLLEELVRDRGKAVPMSSILHPTIEAVIAAVSGEGLSQTPTSHLNAKGSITLPSLTRPQEFDPVLDTVPTIETTTTTTTIAPPRMRVSDSDIKKSIEDSMALVNDAAVSRLHTVNLKSYIGNTFNKVKAEYDSLPKNIQSTDDLEDIVKNLEAKSLQLFILGAAVAMVGSEQVLSMFADEVAAISTWGYGKSGSVSAVETPDVILLAMMYIIVICSIRSDDLTPMVKMLNAEWINPYNDETFRMKSMSSLFYADALGGNAKDVLSHMIELLQSQQWFLELLGVDEGKLLELILQANMSMVLLINHDGESTYPGYNDYDSSKVLLFVNDIKNKQSVQSAFGKIMHIEPSAVPEAFASVVETFVG